VSREDLFASCERAEQPVRIAPPRLDVESKTPHWLGPAGVEVQAWKARALAGEREVERLQRALARRCPRP
jgi:hypothetical protein